MAKAALVVAALVVLIAFCLVNETEAQAECVVSGDCVLNCNGCQNNQCIRGHCLCGCHGQVPCSIPGDCGTLCGLCSSGCFNAFCICQC